MLKFKPGDKNFENNLDVTVDIRNQYRKRCMPFSLKSRNGIAIVFSFYGDGEDFADFMQNASHKTRAFYVNSEGNPGFLVRSIVIETLRKVEDNEIERAVVAD